MQPTLQNSQQSKQLLYNTLVDFLICNIRVRVTVGKTTFKI